MTTRTDEGPLGQATIPLEDVRCVSVDMTKLVARVFGVSRTEAGRLLKAAAVTVIEETDGKIDSERQAGIVEDLMVYSQKVKTYLRCGKRWKRVSFAA